MDSFLVASCLLALVAGTSANPPYALPIVSAVSAVDSISDPSYGFNYAVNDPLTGDNKAQWETRHGDVVHGAYSLVEPDGNIRLVEYTADPIRGFNAVVKRTGPNVHSVGPILAPVHAPLAHGPLDHGPLAHGPLAHGPLALGPLDHGPVALGPLDHGPLAHGALALGPLNHGPLLAPLIEAPLLDHGPIIAPLQSWGLPIISAHNPDPWVSLSGTTYGQHGHVKRRWATGPINLHGKTLTIKTRH